MIVLFSVITAQNISPITKIRFSATVFLIRVARDRLSQSYPARVDDDSRLINDK